MATLEQLSSALVKADAAGNVADAKALADAIRQMQSAAVAAPSPELVERRSYALSEVPGQAIANAPESLVKFGTGLYQAVSSPIETTRTLMDVVGGGIINALPKDAQAWMMKNANDPRRVVKAMETARAVGMPDGAATGAACI